VEIETDRQIKTMENQGVTQRGEESRKKVRTKNEDMNEEEGNNTKTQEEQPQQETQVQNKAEEEEENKVEQDTESEHAEKETTESEDEEDEKNKKRYNLRKRKGRTVYVAASKIFLFDNLRDTDDVIKSMKRGYEVSIGGSFFAGSEGSAQIGQQDGTGNQHDDPEMDNGKEGAQPERDQDAQPQQQKQPWLLANLARYNIPGIKDNRNVRGKRNQCDRHQIADECQKKRDRITQSDMQHKEKQQRLMETIRAEMFAHEQETTTPTSSQVSSRATLPTTSRVTSPSPMRKISRRERVDENLQDISTRMQPTGQILTAATLALFKNIKPNKKYR
jgi:hypothetical protein